MRLIDADKIMKCLDDCCHYSDNIEYDAGYSKGIYDAQEKLLESQTIDPLDALGIYQCKDCIYSEKFKGNDTFAYCYFWEYEEGVSPNVVELNGFCSNSEKRKE